MFEWLTLELIISSVAFLLTVILTTMLSGVLVKMGSRYGKMIGSPAFQSKEKLYWAFLGEAILLSVTFAYFESAMVMFVRVNMTWLPSIIVEAFIVYYIWFCGTFKFKIRWQPVLLPQLIVALNYFVLFH